MKIVYQNINSKTKHIFCSSEIEFVNLQRGKLLMKLMMKGQRKARDLRYMVSHLQKLQRQVNKIKISGVDNIRFAGRKVTAATVTAISKTTDEDDFAVREAIYEKNRAEMQYQFRYNSLVTFSEQLGTFSGTLQKISFRSVEGFSTATSMQPIISST